MIEVRMGTLASSDREADVRLGLRLEYANVGYNALEAVVALASGAAAGSIALLGFGADSLIETASSLIMLWRLHSDNHVRREAFEHRARRLISVSFWVLAAWVAFEAGKSLWEREAPSRSWVGIVLAVLSILIMPLMARAKRRVGQRLGSAAMVADSRQTDLCAWLSVILLAGLALNAAFGWWWADPAAGLLMTPVIAREGFTAWKGEECGCH
jgi:divalent metal cation (Fe/Co/Zn/Cd) transporter